jgi:hypothetical protein
MQNKCKQEKKSEIFKDLQHQQQKKLDLKWMIWLGWGQTNLTFDCEIGEIEKFKCKEEEKE